MRVSAKQLVAHRDAILVAAGRLFRAHGIDAVSVADVMGEAGLTHGGFYGHYRSKADLAAKACRHVLANSAANWRARAADAVTAGADPIEAIVSAYLSVTHLEHPESGCALPSLATETARFGGTIAAAMTDGMEDLLAVLTELSAKPPPDNRQAAIAALSTMVGGILLARASNDSDHAHQVLDAVRGTTIQILQQP